MSVAVKIDDIFVLDITPNNPNNNDNIVFEDRNLVIIEDDSILNELLTEMAKKYYKRIFSFKSVENASLFLANVNVNVDTVLIDYFLPGEKGTKIISLMREINKNAKIYLMSGDLSKVNIEDSNLKELEEYIEKPLSFKQIKKIYSNF